MRQIAAAVCLTVLANFANGQNLVATDAAEGVVIRGLDTVSGILEDIEVQAGEAVQFRALTIKVSECRYPRENMSSDAYSYLTITETDGGGELFNGWMIASSPALSAMDHPRYDVWVLRCMTAAAEPSDG